MERLGGVERMHEQIYSAVTTQRRESLNMALMSFGTFLEKELQLACQNVQAVAECISLLLGIVYLFRALCAGRGQERGRGGRGGRGCSSAVLSGDIDSLCQKQLVQEEILSEDAGLSKMKSKNPGDLRRIESLCQLKSCCRQ